MATTFISTNTIGAGTQFTFAASGIHSHWAEVFFVSTINAVPLSDLYRLSSQDTRLNTDERTVHHPSTNAHNGELMSLSPEMIAALAKQVERYSSEPTPLSEYLDENHEAGGTNGEMLLSYRDDIEVSLDTIADAIRLKDEEEQAQVIDQRTRTSQGHDSWHGVEVITKGAHFRAFSPRAGHARLGG